MKRSEAKELQKKYGLEIMRNPVTGEAWGLRIDASEYIPELDDLAKADIAPCAMKPDYSLAPESVIYELVCPKNWFDLWGWADV